MNFGNSQCKLKIFKGYLTAAGSITSFKDLQTETATFSDGLFALCYV